MTNWYRKVCDSTLPVVRTVGRLTVRLFAFILVLLGLKALHIAYTYHFGFDRAQWAASADALQTDPMSIYDNPRENMLPDVLAHELRLGMSRNAVLAVLGPADRVYEGPIALTWYWSCGMDWTHSKVIELEINYSKQGTVTQYRVRQ